MNMSLFRGKQRGFSLVELLIGIMIMGVLGVAVSAVLVQLLQSPQITRGGSAIVQVQAVGDAISQDAVQAQSVVFGDDIASDNWSLVLSWEGSWTDSSTGRTVYHSRTAVVTYTLEEMGGLHRLQRHAVVTNIADGSSTTEDTTRTIGRYLDRSQMSCQWQAGDSRTFDFTVVSMVIDKTERRTYSVTPRPGS